VTDVRTEQHRYAEAATRHGLLPEASPEDTAAVHQLLALADHEADGPAGDPELAHHTVATVVRQAPDGTLHAWSRQLVVTASGSVTTADVLDVVADGRIARRTVVPRHTDGPLPELPW
jgi:hypothetical protein